MYLDNEHLETSVECVFPLLFSSTLSFRQKKNLIMKVSKKIVVSFNLKLTFTIS